MKKILGTMAALVIAAVVNAQVTVHGIVKDKSDAPLQGVVITADASGKHITAINRCQRRIFHLAT